MRKGIDGLATIIQGAFSLDPYSKSLYLFCGRNAQKLKGLLWEGDGFLLLNKHWTTVASGGRVPQKKQGTCHRRKFAGCWKVLRYSNPKQLSLENAAHFIRKN